MSELVLEEAIPRLSEMVASNPDQIRTDLAAIRAKLEKPKGWEEGATKSIEGVTKMISLGSSLLKKSSSSCKLAVIIVNNVADLVLEIAAQSADGLHAEAAGKFECAPDVFIPYGSAATMTSARRANSTFGDNINCVVYRPRAGSKAMQGFQLEVAWDVPALGSSHYYVGMKRTRDIGADQKYLRTHVIDTKFQGQIDTSEDAEGSGCDVYAFADLTSDELKVWLSPKRRR